MDSNIPQHTDKHNLHKIYHTNVNNVIITNLKQKPDSNTIPLLVEKQTTESTDQPKKPQI
jgi:predicted FMN-binding regulatory protein PaiB